MVLSGQNIFTKQAPDTPRFQVIQSIHASQWQPEDNTDIMEYQAGTLIIGSDNRNPKAPLTLPHNAEIISIVVYGSETDEDWQLRDANLIDGGSNILVNAAFNTRLNVSIIIDNNAHAYSLSCTSLDTTDEIYGAQIIYTTKLDEQT